MSKVFRDLSATYSSILSQASPELREKALTTYRALAADLRRTPITGQTIMSDNEAKLITRIQPIHLGRLCMFYYFPKGHQELPYFDRFPLVMPLQADATGFLGLNFHYLPPKQRAILLDALDDRLLKQRQYSERRRMTISYAIMKRAMRTPLYIPTIKRYLYERLKSRINVLPPSSWNFSLFLPLERFEKASAARVHIDSLRKARTYGSF
jgi:hypothetical protein